MKPYNTEPHCSLKSYAADLLREARPQGKGRGKGGKGNLYSINRNLQFVCNRSCDVSCKYHSKCASQCHDHALCTVQVEKCLPCGHTGSYACHLAPNDAACTEMIETKHPYCQHTITIRCGTNAAVAKCHHHVGIVRAGCGHLTIVECHVAKALGYEDVDDKVPQGGVAAKEVPLPECTTPVSIKRPNCGHRAIIECRGVKSLGLKERAFQNIDQQDGKVVPQQLPLLPCAEAVYISRPDCGHTAAVTCHLANESFKKHKIKSCNLPPCDPDTVLPLRPCTVPCGKLCSRGVHRCEAACHVGSNCKPCDKIFEYCSPLCGHRTSIVCSSEDPLCTTPVTIQCPPCAFGIMADLGM